MSASKKWKDDRPSVKEWQERARSKIQASNLLNIAIKAAMGEEEISTSRAAMIRTLLDRVLPAQTQSDVTTTTTDAPADLGALKAAIAQSPELKAMLQALIANPGTSQPVQLDAATPANTIADLSPKDIGKNTREATNEAVSDVDSNGMCDNEGRVDSEGRCNSDDRCTSPPLSPSRLN